MAGLPANPLLNIADLGNDLPKDFKNVPNRDYLPIYTTIRSSEQKQQYKSDFASDFDEYQRLHAQVSAFTERYTEWYRAWQDRDLNDLEAVKKLQQEIERNFHRDQSLKVRFEYLHEKLGHIKRLVVDYDALNSVL